ncbi:hypothetical protein [Brevundimonas sp.]|uniref:hypothetical protein n=1 Tax=Brevundimonas sp. TaxID=1871086 RepID=UPI003783397E
MKFAGMVDIVSNGAVEFTVDSEETSFGFLMTTLGGLADDGFELRGVVVAAVENCRAG